MFLKNRQLLQPFLFFIVFFCAYLSYSNNIFKVASGEWFKNHQIDSEQLVLDGILNNSVNDKEVALGRYSRPTIERQYLVARDLYVDRDMSGEFRQYKSQFGLQIKVFAALAKKVKI